MALATRADFTYGNTRLRARRDELLDPADYDGMLGRDLEGMLGALTATVYRPQVEDAIARYGGHRRVHEAVRAHLVEVAAALERYYEGRALDLVRLHLARWDLANLLSLLRGQLGREPAERALDPIVPIGAFDLPTAEEIARQREPAEAIELMVGWKLPDAETAADLRHAYDEFERTDDLASLEGELVRGHTARTIARAQELEPEAEPLLEALAARVDAGNVITVLRLSEAGAAGELRELPRHAEVERLLLEGGTIPARTLTLAAAAEPAEAADRLIGDAPADWRLPLGRYVSGGDLAQLETELEEVRLRRSLALLHRGDPLGAGVMIAFFSAKEIEVRNLRLIAIALTSGADPDSIRDRLVIP